MTPTAQTLSFHIDGMHCGSCALLIDDALHDLPGVIASQTNLRKAQTTVQLDTTDSSPQDVINAITELGYQARPTTGLSR